MANPCQNLTGSSRAHHTLCNTFGEDWLVRFGEIIYPTEIDRNVKVYCHGGGKEINHMFVLYSTGSLEQNFSFFFLLQESL